MKIALKSFSLSQEQQAMNHNRENFSKKLLQNPAWFS
jgi:hypothetical protein